MDRKGPQSVIRMEEEGRRKKEEGRKKKKKAETMFRDWVRGRAVPFCSPQPHGPVTKNKDETAHFLLLFRLL